MNISDMKLIGKKLRELSIEIKNLKDDVEVLKKLMSVEYNDQLIEKNHVDNLTI